MPNARYCVIREDTNIVVNVVVWDGNLETWQPPENCIAVQSDEAGIGWEYDELNNDFENPDIEEPPE